MFLLFVLYSLRLNTFYFSIYCLFVNNMLAQNIHLTEHLAFFQLHYMLLFLVLQTLLLLFLELQQSAHLLLLVLEFQCLIYLIYSHYQYCSRCLHYHLANLHHLYFQHFECCFPLYYFEFFVHLVNYIVIISQIK